MLKLTPINRGDVHRKNTNLYKLINEFLDSGAPIVRIDGANKHYCNLACCTHTINRAIANMRHDKTARAFHRDGVAYLERIGGAFDE